MSRPKNADQVKHKYTIWESGTAVLLNIPNIQGYHTRSVLGLLGSETEGTRILRRFGKRLQMDIV